MVVRRPAWCVLKPFLPVSLPRKQILLAVKKKRRKKKVAKD